MIQVEKELPILKAILTDSNFAKAFEKEISEAPKIPDVVKYWQECGINVDDPNEMEKRGPEIRKLLKDFGELLIHKKIPENCYKNDITATHTYKILKEVQSFLGDFQTLELDYLTTGEGIIDSLTALSYKPVIRQIIDVIIQDNVSIPAIIDKKENKYRVEKRKLNKYLKKERPNTSGTITYDEIFEKLIEEAEKNFNPWDKNKIQIAAFAEIMFEKGWLASRKNRIKTCNEFAIIRYKKNVNVSLRKTNKACRDTHKAIIMKHFN